MRTWLDNWEPNFGPTTRVTVCRDDDSQQSVMRAVGERRTAILELMREEGEPLSTQQIADRLGIDLMTARSTMAHLREAGAVERLPVDGKQAFWQLTN